MGNNTIVAVVVGICGIDVVDRSEIRRERGVSVSDIEAAAAASLLMWY